ncbi:hypothetical protein [Clostridium sp. HBUAS56010]|uniref:tetratricopeptide repeat protein n=1 Tax=Clostridium sp. HBUAS56010 TaxID=2571127 RepID=UPI0011781B84|nr:hypothetical protein [Clostridium sp. HBUAS56010]
MDKYEFNIKVEQIKKLVGKNDYETAMKIADTIDWRRVRNTNLLSMVAMVYEKNEEYQEAKDILLQAFERAPIGKRLLYKLAELAIKEGNVEEAEAYYKEFGDLASEDPRQQLLRYMILKLKGAPAQQLIHSLESYTSVELDEKWLYELAELYSLAGMPDRCVETCDKIMLMFGLGKYVDKAMDLKIQYAPLTNYQMDLVENRDKYEAKLRAVEQEYRTGKAVYEESDPEPEEEYYDETPEPDQEQELMYQDPAITSGFETSMQEADVQETLAREMSKISYNEPFQEEESKIEHTRVLEDIRRVGRPLSMAGGQENAYIPDEAPVQAFPDPVFEEEPLEAGTESTSISSAYGQNDSYDEFDDGLESPDYAARQAAATAEGLNSLLAGEEVSSQFHSIEESFSQTEENENMENIPEDFEDEDLEFEDLYEEDEEVPVRNHLMIEARTPEKGLHMAVEALKQIHKENGVKNPVAKITGSKLSKRGIFSCADKLAGKDLIIEEAGDLSQEALEELNQLMDQDNSGMIVVLIDNPKQMEMLHLEHPVLARKFECIGSGEASSPSDYPAPVYNGQIPKKEFYDEYAQPQYIPEAEPAFEKPESHKQEAKKRSARYNSEPVYNQYNEIPQPAVYDEEHYNDQNAVEPMNSYSEEEMDLDEFAQYACRYANEIDCSITGKSMLALYERIEIMEEDGIPLNKANAESLIESAADRAEKPSLGKRIKNLFSSKYDKDGLLVLKEEHFIY